MLVSWFDSSFLELNAQKTQEMCFGHGQGITSSFSTTDDQWADCGNSIHFQVSCHGAHGDIPDSHDKCVIHKAACFEELAYLRTLCMNPASMASLLIPNEEGATALMLACQREYLDHVKTLLAAEPCLTVTDKSEKTALHYCVENESARVAELLLLTDKSIIDLQDSEGYSALQLAVIACNIPVVTLLLKRGADINQTDSEGHTVVHWATVCGHVVLIDLLESFGANMSYPDSHQAVPLHYAAQMCALPGEDSDSRLGLLMLHKLLSKKLKVDCADEDKRTPLLWAASSGSRQACEMLLNAGAKKEAADKDGLRALHCAASRGNVKCIQLLVRQQVNVNSTDRNGCTPLFYAVSLGHVQCVKVLLMSRTNASHQDNRNRSPAHGASALGSIEVLKLLAAHSGKLWLQSSLGESPIHEAALANHNDVVQYLLETHPQPTEVVDSTNTRGRTCLHIAALTNNLPLCQLLLNYKAALNPMMNSSEDKLLTPYDAAVVKGHTDCADWLRSHGGVSVMESAEETDKHRPAVSDMEKEKVKDTEEHVLESSEEEDRVKKTAEVRPESSEEKQHKVEKTAEVRSERSEEEQDKVEKTAELRADCSEEKQDKVEKTAEPESSEKQDKVEKTEESESNGALEDKVEKTEEPESNVAVEDKMKKTKEPESNGALEDKPSKTDGTTEESPVEEKVKNRGDQSDKPDDEITTKANDGGNDKDPGDSDKEHASDDDKKETDEVKDNLKEDDNEGDKGHGDRESEADTVVNSSHDSPDTKATHEESGDCRETTKAESPEKTDSGKTGTDSVQVEKGGDSDLVKSQPEEKLSEESDKKDIRQLASPLHKESGAEKDGAKEKFTEKQAAVSDEESSSSDSSEDDGNPNDGNPNDGKPNDGNPNAQQKGLDKDHPAETKEGKNDQKDKPQVSGLESSAGDKSDATPQKPDVSSDSPADPSKSDDTNKEENSDDDSVWSSVHKKSEGVSEKRNDKDVASTPQEEKPTMEGSESKGVPEHRKKIEVEPRDSGMENSTDGDNTSEDDTVQDKASAKENQSETWAKISPKSPSKNSEPCNGRNQRSKPQRPKTVCVTERRHLARRPQPIKSVLHSPEKRRKSQQEVLQKEREYRQVYNVNHSRPPFDNSGRPVSQLARPKTSIGLQRCRNEIQESVRIFEVKKLVIQMIQKTRKLRMFNTYRQMMTEKGMIRTLLREYNQLSRCKQEEQDFNTVAEWEMFLLDELAQANRAEKDNRMRLWDEPAERNTNSQASSPPAKPPHSYTSSSISDSQGSPRQQSPERRMRSPTREEKRRKLKEEQHMKHLKNIYGQQNIPLEHRNGEPTRYPKSAGSSRERSAASSLASSTTESLPKIHPQSTRQTTQKSQSYSMRPATSHAGQRKNQARSQGSAKNTSSP
ncbi:hypothetical protein LSAT2_007772 [Lamellibrachia satsuma]|nr:hypothetical protein LSAT2_007772 [Lamellibrachia satsuma]